MKSIFKIWFLGKFWFYLLFYIYFSTFQSSATNDDHSANNLLSELPRTTSTEFIPLIIVQLECQYSTRFFFKAFFVVCFCVICVRSRKMPYKSELKYTCSEFN